VGRGAREVEHRRVRPSRRIEDHDDVIVQDFTANDRILCYECEPKTAGNKSSHALKRSDTQQPQRRAEHVARGDVQPKASARLLDVLLALHHNDLPRTRNRMADAHRVRDDRARLTRLVRGCDDIRVRPQEEDQVARLRLGQ
jgi:hypothetical protein